MFHDTKKSRFEKVYYPIFEQYLSSDAAKNIKVPILNMYCKVLPKPRITFTFAPYEHESYDDFDHESDEEDEEDQHDQEVDDSNGEMSFQVSNVTRNIEDISRV